MSNSRLRSAIESVESMDDLPDCDSTYEGVQVWVKEDGVALKTNGAYVCCVKNSD